MIAPCFRRAVLGENDFLKKYGHLRPSTYDITVPRYDEMDLSVFKNGSAKSGKSRMHSRIPNQRRFIVLKYRMSTSEISPSALMTYCGEALKPANIVNLFFKIREHGSSTNSIVWCDIWLIEGGFILFRNSCTWAHAW